MRIKYGARQLLTTRADITHAVILTGAHLYWLIRPAPRATVGLAEQPSVYRVQLDDCAIVAGYQDGVLVVWDFAADRDELIRP